MITIRFAALALLASASFLTIGCNKSTSDGTTDTASSELATDGTEAMAANAQHLSLGDSFFGVQSADPVAAIAELTAPKKVYPAGCRSHAKDPSNPHVVHIHFEDCTGPFGLRHLSGDETATLSKNADGSMHVALQDDGNLTVNGKAAQHNAAGDVTFSPGKRNVAWKGAWTRVNDKGLTVSHTTDLTAEVDLGTSCRTTNGTGVTNVGQREVDTTINSVAVCLNANGEPGCPTGEVIHERKPSGNKVTIEFDGSAEASVTGPKGNTFDVALVCTP
jgi:hypothetical protein